MGIFHDDAIYFMTIAIQTGHRCSTIDITTTVIDTPSERSGAGVDSVVAVGLSMDNEVKCDNTVASVICQYMGGVKIVMDTCGRSVGIYGTLASAIGIANYPSKVGAHTGIECRTAIVVDSEIESDNAVASVMVKHCSLQCIASCIGIRVLTTSIPVSGCPSVTLASFNIVCNIVGSKECQMQCCSAVAAVMVS